MVRFIVVLLAVLPFSPAFAAQQPQVAFTFDDLPAAGDLPPGETRLEVANQILAVIKSQHLPPVYGMVNAFHLKSEPDTLAVLKAWRAAGQPLASHTYSHMMLGTHTAAEFEQDVLANEPVLQDLTGDQKEDWRYLRYPFLDEGNTPEKRLAVRQWLDEHHYKIAEVTLDFSDYLFNAPYARCVAKHDTASIVRLHDLYLATARQQFSAYRAASHTLFGRDIPYVLLMHIGAFDAHMFPELIAQMRADGWTFTTLPEVERDPAYTTDPAKMAGGGTLDDQLMKPRHLAVPHRDDPSKELNAMCR